MSQDLHAPASPSALHRIKVCHASMSMQAAFPKLPWEDEEASAEGTCAHWGLAIALVQGTPPPVGMLDPAGTPLDEKMLDAIDLAVGAVDQLLAQYHSTRADLIVEQRVSCKRIHADCWGTPDIRFWSRDKRTLVVIDFKYGFRYVTEYQNDQLVAYTTGAIDDAGKSDLEVLAVMAIIQPRAYGNAPCRVWAVNAAELRAQVNTLAMAVDAALRPNPKATVTPDGCRDCRARHACPTYQTAGQMAMAYSGTPMPMELPPGALSTELRFAETQLAILEKRVSALKAQAEFLIRSGTRLPHHQLKQAAGSTEWVVPDDQVIALGQSMGINLAQRPKAITPLQAGKAGLHDSLAASLTKRAPGAAKLVPFDDAAVRRVFGG